MVENLVHTRTEKLKTDILELCLRRKYVIKKKKKKKTAAINTKQLQQAVSCWTGRLEEGVNGVNRLATKGEKILLTTDKRRKKLPTSDKKIN